MTDNELLMAITEIIDKKIKPIKNDIKVIKVDLLENNFLPRLSNIEQHYISTSNRYIESTDKIEALEADVDTIKKVVREHSEKLQRIS